VARLLLVEDDADQCLLRRLLLEKRGHAVEAAANPAEALDAARERGPFDAVLTDLCLPRSQDGFALIRALSELRPKPRIIVITGWKEDLMQSPEAALVSATLEKPVRMESLLRTLKRLVPAFALLLLFGLGVRAQNKETAFDVPANTPEMVATLELRAPGADWSAAGRECGAARVTVDGAGEQQVFVLTEWGERPYRVFLPPLKTGRHTLRVERDARYSSAGIGLEIGALAVAPATPEEAEGLSRAPVLYVRANTVGRFSDIPLLVYYTRGRDKGGDYLEYTVIFSNEDGGTSTRDLMARWGRTTDIEYVYHLWPASGETLIQTRGHQDVSYQGEHERLHPVLIPVTDNNMVEAAPANQAGPLFRIVPVFADLSANSRELVMDTQPELYRITAAEMKREGKLRPPGGFDGESIADSRLYLVVEMNIENHNSAIQAVVRTRDGLWHGSAVGIAKNFLERSGWARATVELPPGTRLADLTDLGAECLSRRDLERQPVPKNGRCAVHGFGRIFFLNEDYTPGARLPVTIPGWRFKVGEMRTVALK
jgi:CheY-like chemotaxis protein